jgi:probable blue pigment (indigoidine) exporter
METNWRWLLVAAIAPIAWGSTYVVTAQLLPAESPLWASVLRALPAGLLLLSLPARETGRRLPRGSWWWRSAVLGVLNVGAFFILIYLAAQLLPSSLAAMLMATSPAVMMLLAWPLLRERPHILSLIGAVLGFAGVALMLSTGTAATNPSGVIASLAAMTMSSLGFVLTKRWGAGVPLLSLAAWQLTAGGLAIVPIALLIEGLPTQFTVTELLGFAYVTLIATAVAYVAWFSALRHLSAGAVGLMGLLNPVTGVVLGALIAGEAFTGLQLLGMTLVLLGIVLGQAFVRPIAAHMSIGWPFARHSRMPPSTVEATSPEAVSSSAAA